MCARRVVVTGMGMVSPLGNDLKTTWQKLIAGKSGVGRITQFDTTNYSAQIAAEVKDFDPESIVEKKEVKRYDRFTLLALAASIEAWQDSGLEGHSYDPSRMGTIVGVGIGGLRTLENNHQELLEAGPRRISPFLIPAMISNLAPGNIGIRFNLQGVNYTITSACTSGTHAVGEAFRMISGGLQDVVVTGGAEAAITPLGVAGFARMKALSTRNDEPERASRPFDRDRDGFVMGEGAGILVLEELEAAKKRGAKIYGEVVGYGFSCDAYHITAPPEGGEGAIACMRQALTQSGLSLNQVRYVNAHGTSTPINDPAESRAIRKVFGAEADNGLMVSSTKSMTGHLLGAAGGLEAIFSLLAVHTSVVPPTINLENPDEGCDLDYVPNTAREVTIDAAMSNSFGFGGTNASIVVRRLQ
ncbi:MAG: beta-ketoacyl-ACP synthase II [Bdellovibrionota bacterium]